MANVQQKEKENLEKVTDYVEERQLDADRMAAVRMTMRSCRILLAFITVRVAVSHSRHEQAEAVTHML